jgi:WD40 repeat protein
MNIWMNTVIAINDSHLVTNGLRNDILVWDMKIGERKILSGHHINSSVHTLAILESGNLISGSNKEIIIWDVESLSMKRKINVAAMSLCTLKSGYFANFDERDRVKIWDPESGHLVRDIYMNQNFSYLIMKELSNGDLAILIDDSNSIGFNDSRFDLQIWDPSTGLLKNTLFINKYLSNRPVIITLLPNNQLALNVYDSFSQHGTIEIWDISTGIRKRTLIGHSSDVHSMVLVNNNTLASLCFDSFIRIWHL